MYKAKKKLSSVSQGNVNKQQILKIKAKTAEELISTWSRQKLFLATGDVQLLSSVSYNKCNSAAESLSAAGITACLKEISI